MNSLYIHIPFCRSRCAYCDFYSTIYRKDLADSYVDIICKQISRLNAEFETIYIGGGTPTVLDYHLLKKILIKIKRLVKEVKEFTIEANPESLDKEKIDLFCNYSVNRISIGVQSFQNQKLKFLGRLHSAKQAIDSLEIIRKKGFKNISIDLIYGLPMETKKTFEKDLTRAMGLPITHLSTYMLTYEKGTSLWKSLNKKQFLPLTDQKLAGIYKQLMSLLGKNNFFQYEISNFSQPGFRALHNYKYWKNEPYLGLGPAAVSFLGRKRQRNISSLTKYIQAVREGGKILEYSEELTAVAGAKETAALKIRTNEGIGFSWFKQKTGFNFLELEKESLSKLIKQKLIKYRYQKSTKMGVALTKKGILFADTVSSEFL